MSFSFADRLVTQRMRLRERHVSIEMERESLAVKEKLMERLGEKLQVAREQLAKVEQLRESLEKMDAETEVAYKEAQKKDEEARKQLAEDYQARLSSVSEQLQTIGEREAKTNRLNSTYKQQIEIYSQKAELGEAKFDEYMRQRDDKVEEVKAKQLSDAAKIPEFQEMLNVETEQLAASRAAHDEARGKVDVYLARFAEIQSQLDASKKTYQNAKGEKERLMRSMRALESDKMQALKRAEQSRSEHDKQLAKVRSLQEKLDTVRLQTERLNKLCVALEGRDSLHGGDVGEAAATGKNTESAENGDASTE